jgi:prephenate dehydrogenase
MAFLSHVPQVVAWALLESARGDAVARRHLRRAGPGFRDMTRLARSPRPLWNDVLEANRTEVRRALAALVRRLERRRR